MRKGGQKRFTHAGNEISINGQNLREKKNRTFPNKIVLIIAYHFPPAAGLGLPGTQRAVKLAKYLPRFGWSPIILTVRDTSYPHYIELDRQLLSDLSESLIVRRTGIASFLGPLLKLKGLLFRRETPFPEGLQDERQSRSGLHATSSYEDAKSRYQAAKDSITELFELPDEAAGWIIPAIIHGRRIVRKNRIDAIIATGRPWSSLVIGGLLKSLTGVPLVSDFRDPWMTNPFRPKHSRVKNFVDTRLERYVVHKSDLLIANTIELRDEFKIRFPTCNYDNFTCIPNGFDLSDVESSTHESTKSQDNKAFTLVHSGFLYGKRDPKLLIDAVAEVINARKIPSAYIKVVFVGPRELPYRLDEYVCSRGLTDIIEIVEAIPFKDSLKFVASCSAAILLQPDTLTQVPSKLFEYIGLSKKTIAVASPGSATEKLFSRYDLGFFADCNSVSAIADSICTAYGAWMANQRRLEISDGVRQNFDVSVRVEQIALHLDDLASTRLGEGC